MTAEHHTPTQQDQGNAAMRQAIADRQNAEYAEALKLAQGTLGPGWQPWMKLSLIDSCHRQNGNEEPMATAYKVYRGKHRLTENAVFLRRMPDGSVRQAAGYEELFGDLLHEPHPTKRLQVKGEQVPAPRWTLCWSSLELYTPRPAEELAALRVSRAAGKDRKADKTWAEENPLLAQAGIKRQDLGPERRGR